MLNPLDCGNPLADVTEIEVAPALEIAAERVVYPGFSAEALRDRINDAQAKVLITADGGYRRGRSRWGWQPSDSTA